MEKAKVYSQNPPFRDYNRSMTLLQQMTVREFRKLATGMAGEWVAAQDAASGTYTVRCGDIELQCVRHNAGGDRASRDDAAVGVRVAASALTVLPEAGR